VTDDIRDGVSLALAVAFPSSKVYGDERVRQNLEQPSFFVSLGECVTRPLPNRLMEQRQTVEITYFPETQGDLDELWTTGSAVTSLLGELTLPDGSKTRGRTLCCDVSDGLMHIRATYILRLKPTETGALMGDVTIRT